ncbi:MAG: hypothetical protein HND53_04665 [Proteobacteria bacterium]|nr:hypothetical protein [Pseudomonadota bacterium]NOG59771.1 hypothetical protein [Pseudomonadota bacterium]
MFEVLILILAIYIIVFLIPAFYIASHRKLPKNTIVIVVIVAIALPILSIPLALMIANMGGRNIVFLILIAVAIVPILLASISSSQKNQINQGKDISNDWQKIVFKLKLGNHNIFIKKTTIINSLFILTILCIYSFGYIKTKLRTNHALVSTSNNNIWDYGSDDFVPIAREYLKQHCVNDAYEKIYDSIVDVRKVIIAHEHVEGTQSVGGIKKSYDKFSYPGGGVSHYNGKYMFFGLGLEEIVIVTPDDSGYDKLELFNMNTRETSLGDMSSRYIIKFISTSTPEESKVGVLGRDIVVIDRVENRIIAERREFFWMNPNGPATGLVCPEISEGQATPYSFLSEVINPTKT